MEIFVGIGLLEHRTIYSTQLKVGFENEERIGGLSEEVKGIFELHYSTDIMLGIDADDAIHIGGEAEKHGRVGAVHRGLGHRTVAKPVVHPAFNHQAEGFTKVSHCPAITAAFGSGNGNHSVETRLQFTDAAVLVLDVAAMKNGIVLRLLLVWRMESACLHAGRKSGEEEQ